MRCRSPSGEDVCEAECGSQPENQSRVSPRRAHSSRRWHCCARGLGGRRPGAGLWAQPRPLSLSQFLLYCEGTRFTEKKHRVSMEVAAAKGLPVLKYHLLPRTKGFTTAVQCLRGTGEAAGRAAATASSP